MNIEAEKLVEIIGPCTDDVRGCEIMWAAIVHTDTGPENKKSREIRVELAKVACDGCKAVYLKDVVL